MDNNDISTRMKMYEKAYSPKCMPLLPICVRLDGKNFSKWTKDIEKPFDHEFCTNMIRVTEFLVKETQATVGYTQSDEITLIYFSCNRDSQLYFDGKIMKMCSVLASMATVEFNNLAKQSLKFKSKKSAYFDCRVWQVPTLKEAINVLVWREADATKNSITAAAQCYYSHKQLHKKTSSDKIEMLYRKDVHWNHFPYFFKRGAYVRRVPTYQKLSSEDLANLPEKHNARLHPEMEFKRSVVKAEEFPKITSIENIVPVIFEGAKIILKG